MALWARKKGVAVIGTGDFTHPTWFSEISEKLIPAEPGLFRLRADLEQQVDQWLDGPGGDHVRFMLEVEISTIYKKDDKTRKVHHLIYAPNLEMAQNIRQALDRIGNIASDGRPILGLDSRDLLEITLEGGDGCYLIPAHIWTPWFAVLGSKSGFDTIEHCYGDLTHHIFALETGLSSDPPMNWRVSQLDRYTLVSNSDAHSPPKIGREASMFDSEMDYFAMRHALETGKGYGGTVEFFPEEGKYHLDGHRKCGVCLSPEESKGYDNRCPTCGKPLTLGVMHRVDELADRPRFAEDAQNRDDGSSQPHPPRAAPYRSLVPLEEVLSEIERKGPKTKTVQHRYEELMSRLGSELYILEQAPLEDVRKAGSSLVAEALSRMRHGQVIRQSGYDGEYGKIRFFSDDELARQSHVHLLFETPKKKSQRKSKLTGETPSRRRPVAKMTKRSVPDTPSSATSILDHLDEDQRRAAKMTQGPLLIVAGPGTGKTRTLSHRLAHLITDHDISPHQCLAITFTRRAAGELKDRLAHLLPDQAKKLAVTTFHGLGWSMLQEQGPRLGIPLPVRVASRGQCLSLVQETMSLTPRRASRFLSDVSQWKRTHPTSKVEPQTSMANYQQCLRAHGWVDFDDLVVIPVRGLSANPDLVEYYQNRYQWICVDEYQDIDSAQYQLIKFLAPQTGHLCVIGDPDQAIYGFRGANVQYFQQFQEDYPTAQVVHLTRNYRSTRTIVDASLQLVAPTSLVTGRSLSSQIDGPERIEIHQCTTAKAEAEFVVHTIERLIGGSTFFSMDSGRVEVDDGHDLSFPDFAVLYRTDAQAEILTEALERSGMPYQRRSHEQLSDQPSVQALIAVLDRQAENELLHERIRGAATHIRGDHPDIDRFLTGLCGLAKDHQNDTDAFLAQLELGVDVDLWDPRAQHISLLTLHAAKGLEFPIVFIVGCEDGIIPLRWGKQGDSQAEQDELAEERRLLFVGMTRAQQRLYLTHAAKRPWRGKTRPMKPSPFLCDVRKELLDRRAHRPVKIRAKRQDQLALFES